MGRTGWGWGRRELYRDCGEGWWRFWMGILWMDIGLVLVIGLRWTSPSFPFFSFRKKSSSFICFFFFFFSRRRIKIFLFVLLRDIEVSIDPNIEIEKKVKWVVGWVFFIELTWLMFFPSFFLDSVVTRPCVKSEPHAGNQMPLYMRLVPPSDPNSTSAPTTNG